MAAARYHGGRASVTDSAAARAVLDDVEHQTGVRGRVARAGFEPEQQGCAQPLDRLSRGRAAPFARRILGAARHHSGTIAHQRHAASHGKSVAPKGRGRQAARSTMQRNAGPPAAGESIVDLQARV